MISEKNNFVVHVAADPPLESHVRELERYFGHKSIWLINAKSSLHLIIIFIWFRLTLRAVHLFSSRNTGRIITVLQRFTKIPMISIPEIYLDERIKSRRFFNGLAIVKSEACEMKARACTGITEVRRRIYFEKVAPLNPSEQKLLASSVCFVSQATKHVMANEYFDEQSKGAADANRLVVSALASLTEHEQVVILLRPQELQDDQTSEEIWYRDISRDFILLPADRTLSLERAVVARLLVSVSSTVAMDAARERKVVGKETLLLTTGKFGLSDLSATGGVWEVVTSVEDARMAIEAQIEKASSID